jgi:cytochrome oxidase Cu insertion factor (SCO1/SenC/PrrC family)
MVLARRTLLTLLLGAAASPVAAAPIGAPFSLVDTHGTRVTDRSFPGKCKLVFFGYTFCPDICPTALGRVARALEALGGDAARVQPLFITVDSERDTPAVLGRYMQSFERRIAALSGTEAEIATAARAFRVSYARHPIGDGDYLMDHTALFFLIAPDGRLAKVLRSDVSPDALVAALRGAIAPSPKGS